MNNIDLSGRAAVITGGARGIGFATAQRFLRSGARVALWDIDESRVKHSANELAALGTVSAHVVELTDESAIQAALAETKGNRRKAAEMLGIGERTMYRKLRDYEITVR